MPDEKTPEEKAAAVIVAVDKYRHGTREEKTATKEGLKSWAIMRALAWLMGRAAK